MNRVLLGFAASAMIVASWWPQDSDLVTGVEWQTDLDAARHQAAESNRPLMLVFR